MKKMKLLSRLVLVGLLLIGVISCKEDDDALGGNSDATKTMLDFINENPDLSSLKAAAERAGITDALTDPNVRYTLLAPTNESFASFLSANGFANLEAVPVPALKQLLEAHLLKGLLPNKELIVSSDTYLSTVSKGGTGDRQYDISMHVNNRKDTLFINGNEIKTLSIDNPTRNAIVHKVNQVIPIPTISEVLEFDTKLASLKAALEKTSLNTTIDAVENVTLLSPNNEAFEKFLTDAGFDKNLSDVDEPSEINLVSQILLNHVIMEPVVSSFPSEYYTNSSTTSPSNDNLLSFINTEGDIAINGVSKAVVANIGTANGVIQILDKVVPLPTTATFIGADTNFASLLGTVTSQSQTNFVEILSNLETPPAPFTVFAPSEAAFAELTKKLTPEDDAEGNPIAKPLITQLKGTELSEGIKEAIIKQHVVQNQNLLAEDLSNGNVTTLGGTLTVNADDSTVTDETGITAKITRADIIATNGTVHAIDQVLLPVFVSREGTSEAIEDLKFKIYLIKNMDNSVNVEVIVDGVPEEFTKPIVAKIIGQNDSTVITLNEIPLDKKFSVTTVDTTDGGFAVTYDGLLGVNGKIQLELANDVIIDTTIQETNN